MRPRSAIRFLASVMLLCICSCLPPELPAQFQLYQTSRSNGSLRELDINTGAILATNVGGIVDGRGMDFSPLGGLYICHSNAVSRLDSSNAIPASLLTYTGETPHDLCFDASGSLYVVTNLNVYVYSSGIVQTLTFAHGLTVVTGDGNANKGWGIEVHPSNGEIYVAGRQGVRRFSPTTGALLGSIPNASVNGFPCLKFTGSGFGGAFLYVGNVISGVDQVRVYDSNLNFLRAFWPAHNGNPIDFEVNPLSNDLYVFNTVTTNPTNRYNASESLVAGWATFGNASRGSALGDFEGVILPRGQLDLGLVQTADGLALTWSRHPSEYARYVVERCGTCQAYEELAVVTAAGEGPSLGWVDAYPLPVKSAYRVSAFGQNGEALASETVFWQPEAMAGLEMEHLVAARKLRILSRKIGVTGIRVSICDLKGRTLSEVEGEGAVLLDLDGFADGLYLVRGVALAGGRPVSRAVFKLLLRNSGG